MDDVRHRGPDDLGQVEFTSDKLSFGHRRLSIIDLGGSRQPMTSSNNRFTIVFNGEIYNYKQLRENLGYPFQTQGDTETLLALWEQEGAGSLKRLRGQFAFAIWDSDLKKLSFATDAFGILPLFVYDDGETLAFSSSANSLAAHFPKAIENQNQIISLLTTRAVVAPETVYLGIRRLPPGALWTYGVDTKKETFWNRSWNEIPPNRTEATDQKVKSLLHHLNQAADRAITSDVEIGVFLSGGIDSALIAKLAQDRLPYRLNAYTAFWPEDKKSSEIDQAKTAAGVLGLKHHEIAITSSTWWDGFIESSRRREGPLAEPADVIFYLLALRAKEDVKVVLTGEGSDEFFGGYPKNQIERYAALSGVRTIASFLQKNGFGSRSEKIDRILSALTEDEALLRWSRYFATNWPTELEIVPQAHLNSELFDSGLRGMRVFDFTEWLAPLLLDRADQMAMAHGLEVRPLLLDYDLAQFAFSLTNSDLYKAGQTKPLLRKAAQSILPPQLAKTPKRGFPIPTAAWLAGPLFEKVAEVLERTSPLVDSLLPRSTRLRLLQEHKHNDARHGKKIFTLLSVMVWSNL